MDERGRSSNLRSHGPAGQSAVPAWSSEEIRRVGYRVVDEIAEMLAGDPYGRAFEPVPREVRERLLTSPWSPSGETPDKLLDEFHELIAPYPLGNGHPRFWAWVCSPPAVMAVFGEALATALNPHCDVGNHAAIYVELRVLDWFKQMLHFPPESRGLLVSGGSVANLTALAVARHSRAGFDVRREGLQSTTEPLVAYVSAEGHSCLRKAAELLGIGSRNVRVVGTDAEFRMDVDELRSRILVDQAAGARPFAVVASAGATNTGAIDPLERIAEVCRRHGLWLHVDGAYGGPAAMSRQYRDELAALELADSVAIDPHKWLQVPVEAGVVLVRDGAAMRDAFSLVPPYLRMDGDPEGVEGPTSFAEFGIQQTRGFRALKIWMALRSWGREGTTAIVEQNIEQARRLHRLVEAAPDLEALAPSSLSVVCFRYVPRSLRGDEERLDTLNRQLVRQIQLGGEAFLGGTLVRGRYALRACIVNHLTADEDVDAVLDLVRREGAALAPQVGALELADVAGHMATTDDDGWPAVTDPSMLK